mmetsp:Transcript_350/g.2751  ORF Transcript_350/g.2751 Transcript_350/m.2751 type:complete len:256 (+) Transcript_350:579-1346(+)
MEEETIPWNAVVVRSSTAWNWKVFLPTRIGGCSKISFATKGQKWPMPTSIAWIPAAAWWTSSPMEKEEEPWTTCRVQKWKVRASHSTMQARWKVAPYAGTEVEDPEMIVPEDTTVHLRATTTVHAVEGDTTVRPDMEDMTTGIVDTDVDVTTIVEEDKGRPANDVDTTMDPVVVDPTVDHAVDTAVALTTGQPRTGIDDPGSDAPPTAHGMRVYCGAVEGEAKAANLCFDRSVGCDVRVLECVFGRRTDACWTKT